MCNISSPFVNTLFFFFFFFYFFSSPKFAAGFLSYFQNTKNPRFPTQKSRDPQLSSSSSSSSAFSHKAQISRPNSSGGSN
jgi:hypothetical protein